MITKQDAEIQRLTKEVLALEDKLTNLVQKCNLRDIVIKLLDVANTTKDKTKELKYLQESLIILNKISKMEIADEVHLKSISDIKIRINKIQKEKSVK